MRVLKYSKYFWCSHCGKWLPQAEAVEDSKGRKLCPVCKKPVRVRRRYYKVEPEKLVYPIPNF